MKKEFLLALFVAYPAFAQVPLITVTANYTDKGVSLDVESKKYGTSTIILKITDLSGYRSSCGSKCIAEVRRSAKQTICTLIKEEATLSPSFNYTYSYVGGAYDARPEKDYPYYFPFSRIKY